MAVACLNKLNTKSKDFNGIRLDSYLLTLNCFHLKVCEKTNDSNYFEISNTIGLILKDKFELKGYYIDRLRWGLVTSIGKLFKNSPHIDTKVPHKTILFYPHDSDGETYFYNDKHEVTESVMPKMNRAVLFDGSVLHSSSKPIQTARRIVLNVNLIHEDTKI